MSEFSNRNEIMQLVISLSEQMLDCARSQSWDQVIDLEHKRNGLLNEFAEHKITNSEQSLITQLENTIKINEEIQFLSKQEMNNCLQKCVSMKRGKKAFTAYASVR